MLTAESREDPRVREIIQLLIHWLNDELAPQRIVVKHIQEDLYDGQIIQKLIEKLANIKVLMSWCSHVSHTTILLGLGVQPPVFSSYSLMPSVSGSSVLGPSCHRYMIVHSFPLVAQCDYGFNVLTICSIRLFQSAFKYYGVNLTMLQMLSRLLVLPYHEVSEEGLVYYKACDLSGGRLLLDGDTFIVKIF